MDTNENYLNINNDVDIGDDSIGKKNLS